MKYSAILFALLFAMSSLFSANNDKYKWEKMDVNLDNSTFEHIHYTNGKYYLIGKDDNIFSSDDLSNWELIFNTRENLGENIGFSNFKKGVGYIFVEYDFMEGHPFGAVDINRIIHVDQNLNTNSYQVEDRIIESENYILFTNPFGNSIQGIEVLIKDELTENQIELVRNDENIITAKLVDGNLKTMYKNTTEYSKNNRTVDALLNARLQYFDTDGNEIKKDQLNAFDYLNDKYSIIEKNVLKSHQDESRQIKLNYEGELNSNDVRFVNDMILVINEYQLVVFDKEGNKKGKFEIKNNIGRNVFYVNDKVIVSDINGNRILESNGEKQFYPPTGNLLHDIAISNKGVLSSLQNKLYKDFTSQNIDFKCYNLINVWDKIFDLNGNKFKIYDENLEIERYTAIDAEEYGNMIKEINNDYLIFSTSNKAFKINRTDLNPVELFKYDDRMIYRISNNSVIKYTLSYPYSDTLDYWLSNDLGKTWEKQTIIEELSDRSFGIGCCSTPNHHNPDIFEGNVLSFTSDVVFAKNPGSENFRKIHNDRIRQKMKVNDKYYCLDEKGELIVIDKDLQVNNYTESIDEHITGFQIFKGDLYAFSYENIYKLDLNEGTSTETQQPEQLVIAPSIAETQFEVTSPTSIDAREIVVFNVSGRTFNVTAQQITDNRISVNIIDLPTGKYFISKTEGTELGSFIKK